MIEMRQFRQFIAVAEELSFRRAADRLNMAQPPLTVTIRQIEEELGTLLIERTNRITRLTAAGRVFLEECRRTVLQAERAVLAARRAGAGMTGTLRITFVASAAREVLPAILLAFRELYPEVELTLTEAMTAQQVEKIRVDEADVGFVIPPLRNADGLTVDVLAKSQMVAALPEQHPLARFQSIALADLAAEPWILFPQRQGPGLHERVLSACAQAGFVPRVGQEALQMDTIASLVAGGLGVGLVTRIIATANRPGVVFRALTGLGSPVEYELAIAYGRSFSILDAFTAMVRSRSNWGGSCVNGSDALEVKQPLSADRPNTVRKNRLD
jgi:DNA-binding transcriptional LysR family regulator